MSLHYDESVILDYVADAPEALDRAAIEEHLEHCAECRQTAREVEQFVNALSDGETWSVEPALGEPQPARIAEFVREAERRLSDGDRAETIARQMMSGAPRNVDAREITPAVVAKLLDTAKSLHDKDPRRALAVATQASDLASKLGDCSADSREQLRGRAFKEQANALWLLGRFPEALEALDAAETHYRQTVASDYSLATVDYVRSLVYRTTDRAADALDLLHNASAVFRAYGDTLRLTHAQLVEGGTLFSQSRYAEARTIFRELLTATVDRETAARCMNNIGHCDERLGEVGDAAQSFRRAATAFRSLGLYSEELRAQWGVARTLVRTGDSDAALEILDSVTSSFEDAGMISDAALSALDAVEILLDRGERDAAAVIAEKLVQRFTAAGMRSSAMEALWYFRRALQEESFDRDILHHVRSFIASMENEPDRPFEPLSS